MARALSLGLVLLILWLLLSGRGEVLLLTLGLVSAAAVTALARRMDVIDREGHPIHLSWRAIFYWLWLLNEIVKANVAVARVILSRRMPIRPAVVRVRASQHTDLGRVVYANSITLTPGTVTVAVDGEHFDVHALTREAADDLDTGAMDRRVTRLESLSEGGQGQ